MLKTVLAVAFFFATINYLGAEERYPIISGVGIALAEQGDSIVVSKLIMDGPASRTGKIVEGMIVDAVKNHEGRKKSLSGLNVGEVVSMLRGPVGSTVTVYVRSIGDLDCIAVDIERSPLKITSAGVDSYETFVGRPFPNLNLINTNDRQFSIESLRGKIVVVEMWASWCPACLKPLEQLNEIAGRLDGDSDKVEFLAVSVDSNPQRALELAKQKEWSNLSHLFADLESLEKAGIVSIPVTVVLDKEGKVVVISESHSLDTASTVLSLLHKAKNQ